MGQAHSAITTLNATNIVTNAILSITQEVYQDLDSYQIESINCYGENNEKNINCLKCEKTFSAKKTQSIIKEICSQVCECKSENIKLSNITSVNMTTLFENTSPEQFLTEVRNSLTQSAYQQGTDLFPSSDKTENINSSINNLYKSIKTKVVQEDLERISTLQIINLKSAGNIVNVDINSATNFINNVLETNDTTASIIDKLQENMFQLTTQMIDANISIIIKWIVRIAVAIITLIILIFIIQIILQIYALYASV